MKSYIQTIILTALCFLTMQCKKETSCGNVYAMDPSSDSTEHYTNLTPIGDNLYSDEDGNLYLAAEVFECFEEGSTRVVWLSTVYCDTCWSPTEKGWKDITTLKNFVDINSFRYVESNSLGEDIYTDNSYRYYHKKMADGGTITVESL